MSVPAEETVVAAKPYALHTDVEAILSQQFTGILADQEAGKLEWRRLPIAKELLPYIYTLLADERVEYSGLPEFMLHAVHMLLEAYIKAGYFDSNLKSELSSQKILRSRAAQARRKQRLYEDSHAMDDALDRAVVLGYSSADVITDYLTYVEDLIRNEPTNSGKQEIRDIVGQSQSVYRAVNALHRWGQADLLGDEDMEQAKRWVDGLAEWGGVTDSVQVRT